MAYIREFNFISILLRLAVAVACGGAIGYGRAKKERPAGPRTYILVCVGGALAVLLTIYQFNAVLRNSVGLGDENLVGKPINA